MKIEGCRVLITGGGRRVGREIAKLLGSAGAHLAIHAYTSVADAKCLADELNDRGEAQSFHLQGDIANPADWRTMSDLIQSRWGSLDVLIHNASVFSACPFEDCTDQDWDHFMSVNARAVFTGTRELLPLLRKSSLGRVIVIGDVAGELIWPSYIPYAVSKAAALALVKGLAQALAPDILVNAVSPGPVLFPESATRDEKEKAVGNTLLKRSGSPADIAHTVRFLIEHGDYMTGQNVRVDGGRSAKSIADSVWGQGRGPV